MKCPKKHVKDLFFTSFSEHFILLPLLKQTSWISVVSSAQTSFKEIICGPPSRPIKDSHASRFIETNSMKSFFKDLLKLLA